LKTLLLLDLDHTLIYGSYAPSESAALLFQYSQYLKIYERPFARNFIKQLQEIGDLIVFTTAKEDYALEISDRLNIQPIKVLSRSACKKKGDSFRKVIHKNWVLTYENILIIDDSPQVWETGDANVVWLVPSEFRGDSTDQGLLEIMKQLESWSTKDPNQ
jgi:TFIIF-interacting CTD phosphatase-like protein